ncbi:uncharacterized protein LOC129599301 [Paramacrobiotus metropolitanus]|uniref:uncharacterized protein LOC129599301 n=1 Tax=Paramacrobiotus metropolitanus TaxID=2943436 RepID=UPI002445E887|nr:uncharacterized protein LOC129599301 [Paramacrobiotus metropolitanus]
MNSFMLTFLACAITASSASSVLQNTQPYIKRAVAQVQQASQETVPTSVLRQANQTLSAFDDLTHSTEIVAREIVSDLRAAKGQLQLNGFDNAGGAETIAKELITKITEQGTKGFFGRIWRWFKKAVRIAHRVIAIVDGFVNGNGKADDATADDNGLIKSVSEVVDYFKPHAAKEIGAAYQFAADSILTISTQHHNEVVRAAQDFLGFLVKYEGTLGKVYAETVQAVESLIKE